MLRLSVNDIIFLCSDWSCSTGDIALPLRPLHYMSFRAMLMKIKHCYFTLQVHELVIFPALSVTWCSTSESIMVNKDHAQQDVCQTACILLSIKPDSVSMHNVAKLILCLLPLSLPLKASMFVTVNSTLQQH